MISDTRPWVKELIVNVFMTIKLFTDQLNQGDIKQSQDFWCHCL